MEARLLLQALWGRMLQTDSFLQVFIYPLFFALQPWERIATPIQSLQQVSMDGVEEVMESQPYGVQVRRKVVVSRIYTYT